MFSCQFNGPKTMRWVFRVQQVLPGLVFGNTTLDSTSSIFYGNQPAIGSYASTATYTGLRTDQYPDFGAWVEGVFAAIFSGLYVHPLFSGAYLNTRLTRISSTEYEVEFLFDLDKIVFAYPQVCEVGFKFVPNPNSALFALRGSNPDSDVRVRNLFGPAGSEFPISGEGAWQTMCCDPPPEQPRDPRQRLATCDELPRFNCRKSAPGIRRVLATAFGNVKAALDELDRVSSLDMPEGTFFTDLAIEGPGTSFTESFEHRLEGSRYTQTMQLQHPHREAHHRIATSQLLRGRYTLLIQDENSRWWLWGRNYPVRATALETKTDTYRQGANNYVLSLKSADYVQAYEVPKEVIEVVPDRPTNCTDYVGIPLDSFTLYELRNCELYDMRNNNLV